MKTDNSPANALRNATELTPDVKGHFCPGLQVLGKNSSKVKVTATKLIGGSLDIDSTVKQLYPEDARWDYAVEYEGKTYFIEVHPAFTGEVETIRKKLAWLKNWLQEKAPEINKIKSSNKPYNWVYTDTFAIAKTSRQYKAIAQLGLLPTATWTPPKDS